MKSNRAYYLTAVAAAVCAALMTAACSNEDFLPTTTDDDGKVAVSFAVTDTDWGGNVQTRSADNEPVAVFKSEDGQGEPLYLRAYVSEMPDAGSRTVNTRGNIITQDNFYGSFKVFGYMYDSDAGFTGDEVPNFMYHLEATKNNVGNRYETAAQYYLPGGDNKVRFFAYAPHTLWFMGNSASSSRFRYPQITDEGAPRYYYRLLAPAQNQYDICFADGTEADMDGYVKFNFKHALAGIRFVADSTLAGRTITNIEIRAMHTSGYYQCAADASLGTGSWDFDDSNNTDNGDSAGYKGPGTLYFISGEDTESSFNSVTVGSGGTTDISTGNGNNHVFFVLPHEDLSNGQEKDADGNLSNSAVNINIIFFSGGPTRFYFDEGSWEAGKMYTYVLSKS